MHPEIRDLLSKFDEPGVYEFPSDFDYERLESKARAVAIRLETELEGVVTFEGALHHQDASFSIAILLRSYEVEERHGLILPSLRFSNFGNLVTLCWEEKLPDELVSKICEIATDEGFHYVPPFSLGEPYDGVMVGEFANWWIRYFDWI